MTDTPAGRIRAAITGHGPITFGEFMDHALYGPGGFYERPPVGEQGHFVTSPHVHPVFADLVRFALDDLRGALGDRGDAGDQDPVSVAELGGGDQDPVSVVELGAGDGTLARQILTGAREGGSPELDYTAVERSAGAREQLRALGLDVAERIDDLPPADAAIVFANELLDNLPFRRVRGASDGPVEIRVGLAGDGFMEVEVPCDDELLAVAPAGLRAGQEVVAPVVALRLVEDIASWLHRGYVLLVDYGAEGPAAAGEVHGYRSQRVHADVLSDPGSSDITAGVDFAAIARQAEQAGLRVLGLVSQRQALLALGFERWHDGQLRRQADALGGGRGREAVGAWESRRLAGILVDDRSGLGRLRWLLLATPDLPAPPWMASGAATPSQAREPEAVRVEDHRRPPD